MNVKVKFHVYNEELSARWRKVVDFTLWPLYPRGKSPRFPLYRRLGEKHSRSERGGDEDNSCP
jgi:hypothetical protein